jgi:hypothetical protein
MRTEATLVVGTATVVESDSPSISVAVVFEDDGQTGYFYAVDKAAEDLTILDASLVYNVADVIGRNDPSNLTILWSKDGMKSALLINNYCRSNFPPANDIWPQPSREWNDSVLELFK